MTTTRDRVRKCVAGKRARGECLSCSNQADPSRVRCQRCLAEYAEMQRKYLAGKRARGECLSCSNQADPSRVRCQRCLAEYAEMQRKYRERKASA